MNNFMRMIGPVRDAITMMLIAIVVISIGIVEKQIPSRLGMPLLITAAIITAIFNCGRVIIYHIGESRQ